MLGGLKLTFDHFLKVYLRKDRPPIGTEHSDYYKYDEGIFTLKYPNESFPVPDNGRYRLDNEIDDCILCDKCAKICPVNCIEIETIRSPQEISKASDGSSIRLYAAKFDIDMAKCCFCGLCTTVCPTECLTMTKTYDFSELELGNLTYEFADMSETEIIQRQEEFNIYQEAKKAKL